MPSFTNAEIRILLLNKYVDKFKPNYFEQTYLNELIDKACIWPMGSGWYAVTEYGQKVLKFYGRVKQGLVNPKCDPGCSGC